MSKGSREQESRMLLMEVCGTHTMAIARSGLKALAPEGARLVSGPGCPVCVTPAEVIDLGIALAGEPDVVLCTFGDMVRVPGSAGSLDEARARGADVRVVYSPRDCLEIAKEFKDRRVVFFAVGFETTQPGIAATVVEARESGVDNFFILPAMKLIPPALRALLQDKETRIDGFILPGHVSVVLGVEPYQFLADEFGRSGVIAGFEGEAILRAVDRLIELIAGGRPAVQNAYAGVVRPDGNARARELIAKVFEPADASWRGLGVIPASGLSLRPEYESFDASRFDVELPRSEPTDSGCRCGEVLKGMIEPAECALFGKACLPDRPVGPCMVSAEGACQAHYRYRSIE